MDGDNPSQSSNNGDQDGYQNQGTDWYPATWKRAEVFATEAAELHSKILEHPPPFEKVKHLLEEQPVYPNIPLPVPGVRNNARDQFLSRLEAKLSGALQYYIQGLNQADPDPDTFVASVALVRSALQEGRQA